MRNTAAGYRSALLDEAAVEPVVVTVLHHHEQPALVQVLDHHGGQSVAAESEGDREHPVCDERAGGRIAPALYGPVQGAGLNLSLDDEVVVARVNNVMPSYI